MRYVNLWLSFVKASAMADMEYRLNIVMKVLGEVIWYVVQLSVFEVLYTHTKSISGWDVHAMRVFMGTLFLVDNAYIVLFHENVEHLNSMVRKGDLDLYLVKPVNSQFMVSCRKVAVAQIVNLAIIVAYLCAVIPGLNRAIGPLDMIAYLAVGVCGLICYYSLRFLFATLVLVLQDAGNVQFIWYQIFRLATRPDPIYPAAMRILVMTALPVAFMASVPSRILVEGPSSTMLVAAPALAGGLLAVSSVAWERALRRYSSASS